MSQLSTTFAEYSPRAIEIPESVCPADEVASLVWSVIDGVASGEDRQRLAELLASERALRRRYVEAVQLDSDLQSIYRESFAPLDAA